MPVNSVDEVARAKAQTAYEVAIATQTAVAGMAKELADHRVEAAESSSELRAMVQSVLSKLDHLDLRVGDAKAATLENRTKIEESRTAIEKLQLRANTEDTETTTTQKIVDQRAAWWGKWGTGIGMLLASVAAIATTADVWFHHNTTTTSTVSTTSITETQNDPSRHKGQ